MSVSTGAGDREGKVPRADEEIPGRQPRDRGKGDTLFNHTQLMYRLSTQRLK